MPMIKTPITIFSRSPILRSMLRIPLIKNTVDQLYPTKSSPAWIIEDSMKHKAVMGMKIVRLYPYMQMS